MQYTNISICSVTKRERQQTGVIRQFAQLLKYTSTDVTRSAKIWWKVFFCEKHETSQSTACWKGSQSTAWTRIYQKMCFFICKKCCMRCLRHWLQSVVIPARVCNWSLKTRRVKRSENIHERCSKARRKIIFWYLTGKHLWNWYLTGKKFWNWYLTGKHLS